MTSKGIASVGALVALALTLTGCTIGETAPTASASAPASSGPTNQGSPTPGQVESESARQAGVDLTNLPAPIAGGTMRAAVDGDPDATIQVSIHALRRSGKVLIGTFSFRVTATVDTPNNLYGFLGQQSWFPFLVDTTNLRRHDVVSGGGARAQTDVVTSGKFRPGQTFYAYAMFAAPPDSVTAMDVQLIDGLPTAVQVQIS